jgi:hypothetical protein
MTLYYSQIRVVIDPEMADPLPDGGLAQPVSVILTDNYDRPTMRPAVKALWPEQARDLAFELLELTRQAERLRSPR